MVDYDYSKRIDENNKRIEQLQGEIVTRKLTIKRLKAENKKSFDAMNDCTSPVKTNVSQSEIELFLLKSKIKKLEHDNKKKEEDIRQLKHYQSYLEEQLTEKTQLVELYKLTKGEVSKDNIFKKIREER